jgi:hypothetical protein
MIWSAARTCPPNCTAWSIDGQQTAGIKRRSEVQRRESIKIDSFLWPISSKESYVKTNFHRESANPDGNAIFA